MPTGLTKQVSNVTSGTINCTDTQQDIFLVHDAAALAATLTVSLPPTPKDGQQVNFTSRLGITVLSITSALTIVGGLTTLAAAGFWTVAYESTNNKWYRIA